MNSGLNIRKHTGPGFALKIIRKLLMLMLVHPATTRRSMVRIFSSHLGGATRGNVSYWAYIVYTWKTLLFQIVIVKCVICIYIDDYIQFII